MPAFSCLDLLHPYTCTVDFLQSVLDVLRFDTKKDCASPGQTCHPKLLATVNSASNLTKLTLQGSGCFRRPREATGMHGIAKPCMVWPCCNFWYITSRYIGTLHECACFDVCWVRHDATQTRERTRAPKDCAAARSTSLSRASDTSLQLQVSTGPSCTGNIQQFPTPLPYPLDTGLVSQLSIVHTLTRPACDPRICCSAG